jgi:hypothetical protein
MDEGNVVEKTRQREKVNSIAVTEDNKASLRVNQHTMSNINTTQ